MTLIYHITTMPKMERAARVAVYVPDHFEADGFIHCAYSHQLRSVAEAKFRGEDNLALLEIDSSRLACSVIEGGGGFPHIHGVLPMEAVAAIREISVPVTGPFELPCNVYV
jgi:uncharacterized protein (DUF952 family)